MRRDTKGKVLRRKRRRENGVRTEGIRMKWSVVEKDEMKGKRRNRKGKRECLDGQEDGVEYEREWNKKKKD